MSRNLLFLILLFVGDLSFAQYNVFKPGYIVNMQGDTIFGEIKHLQWNRSPKEIQFKTKNQISVYTFNDISSFTIKDYETYISANITYHQSVVDLALASEQETSNQIINAKCFVKLIAKGKYSLYKYDEKIGYYFIQQNSNDLQELLFRYINRNGIVTKDESYKNLLLNYALDENKGEELRNFILESDFTLERLLSIINILNGSATELFNKKERKGVFDISLGVGLGSAYIEKSLDYTSTMVSRKPLSGFKLAFTYLGEQKHDFEKFRIGFKIGLVNLKLQKPFEQPLTLYQGEYEGWFFDPGIPLYYFFNPTSKTKYYVSSTVFYLLGLNNQKKHIRFDASFGITKNQSRFYFEFKPLSNQIFQHNIYSLNYAVSLNGKY